MTDSKIALRGKDYQLHMDFSDDDFLAYARHRLLRLGQAQEGGESYGVPASLKDEVAELIKFVIIPDIPDELIDIQRPSGFKIRLNNEELTRIFIQCYDYLQKQNPEQFERLKDSTVEMNPQRIAELEAELEAEKAKNQAQ